MSLLQKTPPTVVYALATAWLAMKDSQPVFVRVGDCWAADDSVVRAWRGKGLFVESSPIANASQATTRGLQ